MLNFYEQRPRDLYPYVDQKVIVGLCFGQLSGAAISLAKEPNRAAAAGCRGSPPGIPGCHCHCHNGKRARNSKIIKRDLVSLSSPGSGLADGTDLVDTCKKLRSNRARATT